MSTTTGGDLDLTKPEMTDKIEDTIPAIANNADTIDTKVSAHLAENVTEGDTPHGIDYELGTWTPEFRNENNDVNSNTYATQIGNYIKKNDEVTVQFNIELSSLDPNYSGRAQIYGLPFSPVDDYIGPVYWNLITLGTDFFSIVAITVSGAFGLYQMGDSRAAVNASDLNNSTFIRGTITYKIV